MSGQLPPLTSPSWSTVTKRLIALVAISGVYLIARQVNSSTWTSIIVALVLAYLLSPIVTFFERRLAWLWGFESRRTLSVLLTWMVVIGVFGLVVGLIVPATVSQLHAFADDLPGLIKNTEKDLKDTLDKPITVGNFTVIPWEELEKVFVQKDSTTDEGSLTDTLQNAVLSLADPALGFLGGAVSFLFTLFFVLVMLFYLMRDGPLFANYLVMAVPESYRGDARFILRELGLIWNAYLRGQILLCGAVAVATYLAALILGLPQPLILGLIAGFLEFIPNLGPTLAAIPAALFALTTSSSTFPGLEAGLLYAFVVGVTYMFIQQLEAIFLVPRILGHSLDLHPFVVLVAILIGASLAGVLGVVLAAPSVATLRLLGRYLRSKLLDEDIFSTMPGYSLPPRGVVYRVMRYFLSKRFPPMIPDGLDHDQSEEEYTAGKRAIIQHERGR